MLSRKNKLMFVDITNATKDWLGGLPIAFFLWSIMTGFRWFSTELPLKELSNHKVMMSENSLCFRSISSCHFCLFSEFA